MQIRQIIIASALALVAFSSYGQDEVIEVEAEVIDEPDPWSGNMVLGYLATSGNTDNKSANFAFDVNYEVDRWHHGLKGRFFSSSEDGSSTAENYRLSWASKYDFTEYNYGVGRLDWKRDRFSSYEYQRFATLAYGRRILDSARHELDAEIGAGWSQSEDTLNKKVSEGVLRLYGEYQWHITATSDFSQTVEVTSGRSNTYTEAVTSLRASIYESLGLTVSYTIQNNTDVVPGTEKTDTITAIGLDYEF